MEGNYNGSYWADQAFPESYRRAFVSASRQIAEHFADRGWNDTLFHGFLNNKNNFKANGWSRGSSPWLLDEPANFQDYWALRYFARAFHEGINQARPRAKKSTAGAEGASFPRLVFRVDDSRPQWRRDALDGLVDYHVVGSAMRQYPRLVFDRKRRFGEIVVEYGGTNPVQASNLQPVGWSLDAWSLGADGVLPWQTIGTARVVAAGRRAFAFLPASGRRPRRGPPGQNDEPAGCRARRGAIDPAEGLSPRAAGRRVPDALGATVRSAPLGGRPAGPRSAAPFRLTPGDRDRRRRGRRPDRLLRASPPGSLGPARADRRGPVPGSSSTPVPAGRLSPSAARSVCGRAVIDHFLFQVALIRHLMGQLTGSGAGMLQSWS